MGNSCKYTIVNREDIQAVSGNLYLNKHSLDSLHDKISRLEVDIHEVHVLLRAGATVDQLLYQKLNRIENALAKELYLTAEPLAEQS